MDHTEPSESAPATSVGQHRHIAHLPIVLLLGAALMLFFAAALLGGTVPLSPGQVWTGLAGGPNATLEATLIWQHRLPRALLAILVGAQFATAGLLLQAVVRNPLAEPGIVGISSGAGLAVVLLLLLGDGMQAQAWIGAGLLGHWLPTVALYGGLLAAAAVLGFSWKTGLRPVQLALNGIAVGSVFNALIMWSIVVWGGMRTELALIWLAGSLYGRDFLHVQVLWPWCTLGLLAAWLLRKPLDLLCLDETVAAGLGMRGMRCRVAALVTAVVLAASAVAVTGPVGFVGLVTPHAARLLVGSDMRHLLPVNMLAGGVLVLAADWLARTLIRPMEIPVGALTTLLGIPLFLWLLHRQRRWHP